MPDAPRVLRPYQRGQYRYALDTPDPKLFVEMRLGKSLVTQRALTRRGARRVLLLGDYTYLPGWEEELEQEGIAAQWFRPPEKQWPDGWQRNEGWFFCHYAYLLRNPQIMQAGWDAVVADESTYLKSPTAKITKTLIRLRGCASSRWVLAGVPDPEGYQDLFTQFVFCDGEFMGTSNFWEWRQRWFYLDSFTWVPLPGSEEAIRREAHRRAFILTKKQAGVDLPLTRKLLVVPLSKEQERIAARVEKDFDLDGLHTTKWAVVVNSLLLQLAGGFYEGKLIAPAKMDLLEQLLCDGELRDQQVVVGFRFNRELVEAWRRLKSRGVTVTYLQGGVPPEERKKRRLLFNAGKRRVFLIQMDTGRFGLNASAADTCVVYSSSPSYLTRRQFEERILDPAKKTGGCVIDLASSLPVERALREVHLAEKGSSHSGFMRRLRETTERYRRR